MKNLFLTKTRWVVTIMLLTTLGIGNMWATAYSWTLPWATGSGVKNSTSATGASISLRNANGSQNGTSWSTNIDHGSMVNVSGSGMYFLISVPLTSSTTSFSISAEVYGWKSGAYVAKDFTVEYYSSKSATLGDVCDGSSTTSGCYSISETINLTSTYVENGTLYIKITPSTGNIGFESLSVTITETNIPVSSVSVDPTSKAIVPGETFTITPTVLPANATDKTVSWSSSATGKATVTSAGVVTGVAAGSATITCTTTSGSKTATCAVTVYGVTLQAKDENGDAIATATPGVPSRTGASISPAANANNYVFKEWAVTNASLGSSATTASNTITNPTGAVTVTAKYYKPRQVIWMVNGEEWTPADHGGTNGTSAVGYNTQVSTLPTAPTPAEGCAGSDRFMGWTTTQNYEANTPPGVLFTTAGASPAVTAATQTFYAVFADYAE